MKFRLPSAWRPIHFKYLSRRFPFLPRRPFQRFGGSATAHRSIKVTLFGRFLLYLLSFSLLLSRYTFPPPPTTTHQQGTPAFAVLLAAGALLCMIWLVDGYLISLPADIHKSRDTSADNGADPR